MKCRFAMRLSLPLWVACVLLPLQAAGQVHETRRDADADLRARIAASPQLPFTPRHLDAEPPTAAWRSGAVSSVAVDGSGQLYALQRGESADPILVLSREGKVLRSWGKGDFTIPHTIRLDPEGNVWTVDAASSVVTKYSPAGAKLLTIAVGGQPEKESPFNGTTDIAFAPNGHLFITDGYGNARVLEYTPKGELIRQWGRRGSGPGELHLPHAIQIDRSGMIYIADRENGRIEEFDLDGRYLGEIPHLGRIYCLKLAGESIWASMGPLDEPPGSPGWVVKLDRRTGRILGHLDLLEQRGGHSIDLMPSGEPIVTLGDGLLWLQAKP